MTRRSNSYKTSPLSSLLNPNHGGGNVLARANSATSNAQLIVQQIESRQAEARARRVAEERRVAEDKARREALARREAEARVRREAEDREGRVAEPRKRMASDVSKNPPSKMPRTNSGWPAIVSTVLAGIGQNVELAKSHEPLPVQEPSSLGSFLSQSVSNLSSNWYNLTTKLLQKQTPDQPSISIDTPPASTKTQNTTIPPASTKTQNTTIDICDFALYYFYRKPELKSDNKTIKTWAEIDQKKRKEVQSEWDSLTHDQKDEFKFSLYLRLSKTNNSDLEDAKLKWQYLSDDQRNIFKEQYQQISQKWAQKALGSIAINPIAVSRPEVVERDQVPMFSSDYSKKPTDTHFLYLSSLYRDFNDNENNFNIKKIIFPPKPLNFTDRGKNPYLDERIVKWGRELSKFGIDREGAEFKENYLENYIDYLIENIALLQSQQQILDQTQDQDRKNKLKTLVAFHYLELSKMLYSGTYGTYTSVNEKSPNSSQQPTSRIIDIIESIPYMYRESLNFEDGTSIYRKQPIRTISAHRSIHLPDPANAKQKGLFRLANGKVLKTYIPVSLPPMGGDGNWEHYQMHKLGNMSKWELLLDGKFNILLQRVADPFVNPHDDRDYGNAYSESEKNSHLLSLEAEKFRNRSYLPYKISMVLTGKESENAALERAIGGQASEQVQPLPSPFSWAPAMWAEKNISLEEHSDREKRYKLQMMSPIQPPTNTCSRRVPTSRDKYVQDTEIVRGFEGAANAVFSSFGGGRRS